MLYYKIPINEGQTDCSAGSILCCAYPLDGYMVCKFESVANVGSGWVEITSEEFEANCPEFPAVPIANPVRVTEDGYTEIDGLRQLVSGQMIKDGNEIRIPTVWDGGVTYEEVITLDENGLPSKIVSDGREIPFEMEGFESQEKTIEEVAAIAEEALITAQTANKNKGMSREFNITATNETGDLQMSFNNNLAWFYIIEVMDSTSTSTAIPRETIALDYYSLISENTYKFPCGAKICGYKEGTKVTIMLLNASETNYRLSRFTGYL